MQHCIPFVVCGLGQFPNKEKKNDLTYRQFTNRRLNRKYILHLVKFDCVLIKKRSPAGIPVENKRMM